MAAVHCSRLGGESVEHINVSPGKVTRNRITVGLISLHVKRKCNLAPPSIDEIQPRRFPHRRHLRATPKTTRASLREPPVRPCFFRVAFRLAWPTFAVKRVASAAPSRLSLSLSSSPIYVSRSLCIPPCTLFFSLSLSLSLLTNRPFTSWEDSFCLKKITNRYYLHAWWSIVGCRNRWGGSANDIWGIESESSAIFVAHAQFLSLGVFFFFTFLEGSTMQRS